jgi:hypothetical protein
VSKRRWGTRERLFYSILSTYTSVGCWCGESLTVVNAWPFWDPKGKGRVTICPKCGREHRTRFVVESRAAKAAGMALPEADA